MGQMYVNGEGRLAACLVWGAQASPTAVDLPCHAHIHTHTQIAICRWVYSRLGRGVEDDAGLEEHQLEQSLDAFFKEPVDDVKVSRSIQCTFSVCRDSR